MLVGSSGVDSEESRTHKCRGIGNFLLVCAVLSIGGCCPPSHVIGIHKSFSGRMPVTGLIAFSDAEPAEEESYISKRDRVAARDEKANLAAQTWPIHFFFESFTELLCIRNNSIR